jgi:hypothetical protein
VGVPVRLNIFNPLQQTHLAEFYFGLPAPVRTMFQGDAIDFVEEIPTVHGGLWCSIPFLIGFWSLIRIS